MIATLSFNPRVRPSRQRVAEHRERLRRGFGCFTATIDAGVVVHADQTRVPARGRRGRCEEARTALAESGVELE